ncbi:hypothetical protein MASR2M8_22520 [Opitutaceae bacterium]
MTMKRALSPLARILRPARLLLGIAAIGLAGCQIIPDAAPDPTRFYVLTGPSLQQVSTAQPGPLSLGLKAVNLAPYLRGRSMLVRAGEHEITYNDYARWAEPLDQGISRILQGQLLGSPSVGRVHAHPFPFDQTRDFDVAVSIVRCEGVREAGTSVARFAALIEVTRVNDGSMVKRQVFTAPDVPWNGQDYAALAAALSSSVERLASEVIASLPTPP